MAYTSGTAADYKDLISKLATFAAANSWVVLTQSETTLYLKGPGPDALDEIYCGLNAFEDSNAGYYNWEIFGSIYYKEAKALDAQPMASTGTYRTYVYLWNQAIPYWFFINGQRLVMVAKVGATYQHMYLGFVDTPATKAQYPYPLLIGGMGSVNTFSYSSSSPSAYWAGLYYSVGRLYMPEGTWGRINGSQTNSSGWYETTGGNVLRPDLIVNPTYYGTQSITHDAPDGSYLLDPISIRDRWRSNIYGFPDGVFAVTGYNNTSENLITVGGVNYLVFQDGNRSGFGNFCAVRVS